MSASQMRAECRKFMPNIFNKTKCSNCFRQKEEHTAEALECNRAARKISKCGYLFVAPGWDFSNPINRTKRWQRRWFVLYDDGELSYSLDEHPDTVPQASIDMNKVVEVSDAEEITGNTFSIAITAPDTVHFVKGTCREEAKWWKEVLSAFLRSKGRHKRNATFPGSQTSIIQPSSLSCRSSPDSRPRYNSCDSSVIIHPTSSKWLSVENEIYPTRDITISVETPDRSTATHDTKQDYSSDSPHSDTGKSYRSHHPASSSSPPTRDKIILDEKVRTRRTLNREKRLIKLGKNFTEDIYLEKKDDECYSGELTSMNNNRNINQDISHIMRKGGEGGRNEVARRILLESEKSKRKEKLKDIADSLTRPRPRRRSPTDLSSLDRRPLNQIKPTRDGECSDEESLATPVLASSARERDELDSAGEKSVRGDPDGCGLDLTIHRYSPSSELRVDLPAEDLLNIKKGWLLKQGLGQEWTKHWFVLRGVALMYYRDPTAEDKGILDGVMDLSSVNNVSETQVQRNYGFRLESWDDKNYVLSAATAGIRNNWMMAIRKAAGLIEPLDMPLNFGEKLERDKEKTHLEKEASSYFEPGNGSSCKNYIEQGIQRNGNSHFIESPHITIAQYDKTSVGISRSSSSQFVENFLRNSSTSHLIDNTVKRSSSVQNLLPELYNVLPDGEYRQKIEGSSKEKNDWTKGPTPLPPSPPLNRTPISKVKERAKTQMSRSRVYNKRSKSSPPSSRRNTLDIVRTEVGAVEDKREESVKRSTILDKVDRHVKEIDELKGQLNLALCERTTAEKELLRLRQRKSEANHQVEELLRSLKTAEDELKLKTQELENFESLKQRYSALVKEHEGMLKSWRESAISDGWREMYQRLKEEYATDKETWEMKLADVTSMLHVATERCEMLARELTCNEETVETLKTELTNLSERLMRGLEENEGLYGRMRELEGRCLSSSRERGRSVDSLSDLTNIDLDIELHSLDKERIIEEYEELKGRFEKAIQEIRAMKKELRESHASYDELELTVINLRQDSKRREENGKAQAALMASRIEDLTLKLSASEKQSRLLKQKILKSESREKRRSLSLKGKESFHIGKETEEKLTELEAKIVALEAGKSTSTVVIKSATPSSEIEKHTDLKSARLRRKSLESVTSSEPMKILVRIFSLERKIAKAAENLSIGLNIEQPIVSISEHRNVEVSKVLEKLEECKNILYSLKSGSYGCSKTLNSLESCIIKIQDLLSRFTRAFTSFSKDESSKIENCADYMIHKLEGLLKFKIMDLQEKKNQLMEKNQLDEEAKLKLFAEKLAYESVLIKKIREAVAETTMEGDRLKNIYISEIEEVSALMVMLKRKIAGENIKLTGNALDCFSVILADRLIAEEELMDNSTKKLNSLLQSSESEINFDNLLADQVVLENLVEKYKAEKLKEIAGSVALETICLTEEYEEGKTECQEDKRIREAWAFAQEALNKELVQAEISHIAMRCLMMYENGIIREQEGKLTLVAEKYKLQEEYLQNIGESLRVVMDKCVKELTSEYEKFFKKLKGEKIMKNNESLKEEAKKYRRAMEDFFSVLAQKAIIDARISFLTKPSASPSEKSQALNGPIIRSICLKSYLPEPDLETRFIYFYQKFKAECLQSVEHINVNNQKDSIIMLKMLKNCAFQVKCLRDILNLETKCDLEIESNVNSIRQKCELLSANLEDIVDCLRVGVSCRQCCALEDALRKVENQYDEEIRILKNCHEQEMKELRGELESQKNSLVCQHEQEQALLMEKTRRLERRLGTLDAEYSQQMDNLRKAYHKTLSTDLENKGETTEDSIRLRYQAEIEQLRALCEKGLIAVDNSHRRIIAELEEKHRQELAAAAAEKEQALAEETQATLAALDAMRKAHETEVQKEINKFKTEFLKKMQSNQDIGALHKEHEAEMEEIKKEILSLSEKYSVKCVESASLEQQLSVVSKQLSQAQEHITQLDARNKQLRAHLVSDADDFETYKRCNFLSAEEESCSNNVTSEEPQHKKKPIKYTLKGIKNLPQNNFLVLTKSLSQFHSPSLNSFSDFRPRE